MIKIHMTNRTNNIQKRFMQHRNGNGSIWTKKYKPIKIIESIKNK